MSTLFENKLEHARSAYLFAIRSLPTPEQLQNGPILKNGAEFSRPSQIKSMEIELGRAFFCRYEGCLEAELKRQDVRLDKNTRLIDWLRERNVTVPENLRPGLEIYRKIRSQLHHQDGASFDGPPDTEIHLLPHHLENFYDLFKWCGTQVARTD